MFIRQFIPPARCEARAEQIITKIIIILWTNALSLEETKYPGYGRLQFVQKLKENDRRNYNDNNSGGNFQITKILAVFI